MKVAVISDIHANYQAIQSVLDDIKSQNCEQVWCLGDIAMAGPQPILVIDFVREQKDWVIIQGNTDKLIVDFSLELFEEVKKHFPLMANALDNDACLIGDDRKCFLDALPAQKEIEIEGVNVLLVHGSPRKNNENIFPGMKIEEVEEMIKGTSADLILCGHTHIPAGYQTTKKQTVVNVGSVGRPMTEDLKSCYAIIDFKNGAFDVQHRFVDYDRKLAASILKGRCYEGADEIAMMLLTPGESHI